MADNCLDTDVNGGRIVPKRKAKPKRQPNPKPIFVAGIDPSLTNCGIVVLRDDSVECSTVIQSKEAVKGLARFRRYNEHVYEILEVLYRFHPQVICIENYSWSSDGNATVTLGEFGGLLRADLLMILDEEGGQLFEITNSQIKKYLQGGRMNMTQVVSATIQRYNVAFNTDHEVIAYNAARIAAGIAGSIPATNQKQREVIAMVTGHGEPVTASKPLETLEREVPF